MLDSRAGSMYDTPQKYRYADFLRLLFCEVPSGSLDSGLARCLLRLSAAGNRQPVQSSFAGYERIVGSSEVAMRFGYGLSRLLGSVYGNGNVVFLPPDGTCVLSPVRNRVVSARALLSSCGYPHYSVAAGRCVPFSQGMVKGV